MRMRGLVGLWFVYGYWICCRVWDGGESTGLHQGGGGGEISNDSLK